MRKFPTTPTSHSPTTPIQNRSAFHNDVVNSSKQTPRLRRARHAFRTDPTSTSDSDSSDGNNPLAVPRLITTSRSGSTLSSQGSATTSLDELLRLFSERDFRAATTVLHAVPRLARQPTPSGSYPLHEALVKGPVPLVLLDALLDGFEEAARKVGPDGLLPLHAACQYNSININMANDTDDNNDDDVEVVKRLIEAHPPALRWREPQDDSLPLHVAVRNGASDAVLVELLTAYPEGSLIQNAHGQTPLEMQKQQQQQALSLLSSSKSSTAPAPAVTASTSALTMAPMLLKAAQAAQARVAREHERKLHGMREAHSEYSRQLEERFQEERSGYVQDQIGLSEQLAHEKERNISLAEMMLEMKDAQQAMERRTKDLQGKLEVERSQAASKMNEQEQELAKILKASGATETLDREVKKKAEDSGKACLLTAVGSLVNDLRSQKEASNVMADDLKGQLQYKEDMVRHLNQLLAKKDEEIAKLTRQLKEREVSCQEATARGDKLQGVHETTLEKLNNVQEEASRLRKLSAKQQNHLNDAKRKIRIQENRLASIKSLVSSLNYNIDSWVDVDEIEVAHSEGGEAWKDEMSYVSADGHPSSDDCQPVVAFVDDEALGNPTDSSFEKTPSKAWCSKSIGPTATAITSTMCPDEDDDDDLHSWSPPPIPRIDLSKTL